MLPTYELSYWEHHQFFNDIDTLVVGAGLVGLSAAIRLKELAPRQRVVVVDRGPLPIGASTRNAGFACFGSMTELLNDLAERPADEVWELVAWRFRGLQRLRARYSDAALGYEALGGWEVFSPDDGATYARCVDQLPYFNRQLADITGATATFKLADESIPVFGLGLTKHLIHNVAEGQLDTGRLMHTLLQQAHDLGIRVWGGLPVAAWEESPTDVRVHTHLGWDIHARQLVLATNAFTPDLAPGLDVRPARNQVLVTEPVAGLKLRGSFHYHGGYVYFRHVGNRILLGGGRHLDPAGETTAQFGSNPAITRYLESFLHRVVAPAHTHQLHISHRWSGILGVGPAKRPLVEALGARTVAAVRLGGMGVAIGVGVGESAAELLTGLAG